MFRLASLCYIMMMLVMQLVQLPTQCSLITKWPCFLALYIARKRKKYYTHPFIITVRKFQQPVSNVQDQFPGRSHVISNDVVQTWKSTLYTHFSSQEPKDFMPRAFLFFDTTVQSYMFLNNTMVCNISNPILQWIFGPSLTHFSSGLVLQIKHFLNNCSSNKPFKSYQNFPFPQI
jgi:hypothetical protein